MYKSLIRPLMSQRGKVGASEGGRALPRLHGQSLGEPAPKPGPAPPRQRHSTCSWRHPPLQRFGKRWGRLGEVSTQPESLHWCSGTLESALKTSLLPYSQSCPQASTSCHRGSRTHTRKREATPSARQNSEWAGKPLPWRRAWQDLGKMHLDQEKPFQVWSLEKLKHICVCRCAPRCSLQQ